MSKKLRSYGIVWLLSLLVLMFTSCSQKQEPIKPPKDISKEQKTSLTKTNTRPTLYSEHEQKQVLKNFPKMYQYTIEENWYKRQEGMFVIPGLLATKTLNKGKVSMCTSMDPQGVATTEDYVIMSANCPNKVHNSVLYIMDKITHRFVKVIVLEGVPHVGGVAYDRQFKNIWVCSRADKKAQLVAISLSDLESYDFDTMKKPITYSQSVILEGIKRASFLTYEKGEIYVGYFDRNKGGILQKYGLNGQGELLSQTKKEVKVHRKNQQVAPELEAKIENKIQGVAFYKDKILFSQSNGAEKPSKLLIFDNDERDDYFIDQDEIGTIEMPERIEQISVEGDSLYSIYESAAYNYRFVDAPKVDRVLTTNLEKMPLK